MRKYFPYRLYIVFILFFYEILNTDKQFILVFTCIMTTQIGRGSRGDVTMLPTLIVNNIQYRGIVYISILRPKKKH